jgi:hypothetical protein
MAACANAAAGRSKTTKRAATDRLANIHIEFLLLRVGFQGRREM